jgi:hypothetical protein
MMNPQIVSSTQIPNKHKHHINLPKKPQKPNITTIFGVLLEIHAETFEGEYIPEKVG